MREGERDGDRERQSISREGEEIYNHRCRHTDRQAGGQTDRQKDGQIDRTG